MRKIIGGHASFFGPLSQKQFLGYMGIQVRAKKLIENCNHDKERIAIIMDIKRLVEDMGNSYQVCAVTIPTVGCNVQEQVPYPFGL